MAANPVIAGFNDKKIPLTGAAGSTKQLVQHTGKWSLHGRLAGGPSPKSVVLDQLTWKWSKSVVASVNTKTRLLTVTSNGKGVVANGASVAIPNGALKFFAAVVSSREALPFLMHRGRRGWQEPALPRAAHHLPPHVPLPALLCCQPSTDNPLTTEHQRSLPLSPMQSGTPRKLEITASGVTLKIEQPWSSQEGKWAPWLNLELSLTKKPSKTLVGSLGATLPITTGAWQTRKGSISYTQLVRRRSAV